MECVHHISMSQCVKVIPVINEETGVLEPEKRSGHRIVADEANLYSIGGYNPDFWDVENNDESTYYPLFKELWQFNFASRQWRKLVTSGPMPVELASHSAVLEGRLLLVFGGTGVPFGDSASNQLSICNLDSLRWSVMKTTGELPTRVYGQSVHMYEGCMYVFGGTTGWEYNSELHKLDLNTGKWTLVNTCGDLPEGRYRHEVIVDNDRFFVFGGGRSYLCYGFDIISVFYVKTGKWSTISTIPDASWPHDRGFPAARRCHSCVKLRKDVYIAGGYDGTNIHNDIWKLCMVTLRWTKLPTTLPEPAYFHSAAVTPLDCMYIFGGVTEIDNVRTSSVYKMWPQPPLSLKELCWEKISAYTPHMDRIPKEKLLEFGIPAQYVSRILGYQGPSVCA